MVPEDCKDRIRKLFAENLHIKSCSTNHADPFFGVWEHSPGMGFGRCQNPSCGLVILSALDPSQPNGPEPKEAPLPKFVFEAPLDDEVKPVKSKPKAKQSEETVE